MPISVFKIHWKELGKPTYWVTPMVLSAVLVGVGQVSFLLFHSIAEGMTIIVAGMMAATAWQTYDLTHNRFFTFLGYGFFWAAVIDLGHTVAYKGMLIVPIENANAATQLWVGARYLEALVLATALLRMDKLCAPGKAFVGLGILALGIFLSIWGGIFPDAYIEPKGLTPFKVVSEYVIVTILLVALVTLGRRRNALPSSVVAPLGIAILITIISELAFTFYVDVYDLSNMVGHILKLFAFWFVFIAIVRTTLSEPFAKLRDETILQQRTARDLRESEERLRSIMENTQDAIVMIDDAGRVTFWNKRASDMFGYSRQEAMGQEVHDMVAAPEDLDMIRGQIAAFARTGEGPVIGKTLGLKARRKDGTTLEVELSVSAVHDQDRWAAIATVRDVTDRIEAERQMRQLQKSEAIENLSAGIAHDFKNMLLPIVSLTGMCLKSMPKDSREHIRLEKVLEASNRATDLAQRILDYAHEEPPAVEKTDLSALVQDTAELLQSTLLKTISVKTDITPNLEANVDPTEIRTVIMNLGSNASDAMEGRTGTLAIGLTPRIPSVNETMALPTLKIDQKYALLTVRDEGVGMDKETLARIFDPYFTTKAVGKGTGLGLPVVHSIVIKHGGAIVANSKPGEGTEFKIYLPMLG